MAPPLGYRIQFRPYTGKDWILQEYGNIGPGLGASVVVNLVSKFPVMQWIIDVVIDVSLNIIAVRWKDNKVVNAISTLTDKQPI